MYKYLGVLQNDLKLLRVVKGGSTETEKTTIFTAPKDVLQLKGFAVFIKTYRINNKVSFYYCILKYPISFFPHRFN